MILFIIYIISKLDILDVLEVLDGVDILDVVDVSDILGAQSCLYKYSVQINFILCASVPDIILIT